MRNGELVSSLQCVYHYRFIRLLAEVEKTPKKHKAEGRRQRPEGKREVFLSCVTDALAFA
jgi:hypothetical protein